MTTILLESEWEAHDIKEWCKSRDIYYNEISQESISLMTIYDFLKYIPFCNTTIIQKYLKSINHPIQDTYPSNFNALYHRNIRTMSYYQIKENNDFPYFIKPVGNSKDIDGSVISSKNDLDDLFANIDDIDHLYYISNVVIFVVEYRLFVGDNKVYAKGYQKGKKMSIHNQFIDDVIDKTNGIFYVIDVGFIKELNKWAIVEVNPTFSLDDYGIDIDAYMSYCINAWKSNYDKTLMPNVNNSDCPPIKFHSF